MCQTTYRLCDDCATLSVTNEKPCSETTCKIRWIFDPTEPEDCLGCAGKAKRMEEAGKSHKAGKAETEGKAERTVKVGKTGTMKKMTKACKLKLERLQRLVDKMDAKTVEAVRAMLDRKMKALGNERTAEDAEDGTEVHK